MSSCVVQCCAMACCEVASRSTQRCSSHFEPSSSSADPRRTQKRERAVSGPPKWSTCRGILLPHRVGGVNRVCLLALPQVCEFLPLRAGFRPRDGGFSPLGAGFRPRGANFPSRIGPNRENRHSAYFRHAIDGGHSVENP